MKIGWWFHRIKGITKIEIGGKIMLHQRSRNKKEFLRYMPTVVVHDHAVHKKIEDDSKDGL